MIAVMSKPVGPYTPIVRGGDMLAVSGQLGMLDGALVDGFEGQVRQAIVNLRALLATEGATLADLIKTNVFLVDMDDFGSMNGIYLEEFGEARPARSTVAVAALPFGGRFEIEAWAFKPV